MLINITQHIFELLKAPQILNLAHRLRLDNHGKLSPKDKAYDGK